MVPSVAKRGSSFKGAGAYYLHDKGKDTAERVAWTRTHNVPTKDPHRAIRCMITTATHAEQIKARNGTSRTGAKSQGKPVYAYSLAWHESDKPEREEMEAAAMSSLEKLGLKDHEAVIVAHRDQKHPHVHVIANLVHPTTGRTQAPKMDYNRLSTWAQAHDLEHGRNHCPLRSENNAKRQKDKAKTAFTKHKEKRHDRAAQIQTIAAKAKTGEAFRDALAAAGYTLAQGHKGRICIVDREGKSVNLTRQLKHEDGKGYRVKDTKTKLEGVVLKDLPHVKAVQERMAQQSAEERGDGESKAAQRKEQQTESKPKNRQGKRRTPKYDYKKRYGDKRGRKRADKAIEEGQDRDGYAMRQEGKMLDAAMDAAKGKAKTEREEVKRQEDGRKTKLKKDAAEARQGKRHAEARKMRVPYRDGGHARDEFNEEVKDKGRAGDERRIDWQIKKEANDNQDAREKPLTKTASEFYDAAGEKKKSKAARIAGERKAVKKRRAGSKQKRGEELSESELKALPTKERFNIEAEQSSKAARIAGDVSRLPPEQARDIERERVRERKPDELDTEI
jgi:hypothetical protein